MAAPHVDYPNRKLSMRHAASDEDAMFDTNAWAQVALSNLKVGEKAPFESGMATVKSISERQLVLVDQNGAGASLTLEGPRYERLVRDLGGLLLAAQHGSDRTGDALTALRRDPAFIAPGGVPFLRDTAVEAPTATAAQSTTTRKPRP